MTVVVYCPTHPVLGPDWGFAVKQGAQWLAVKERAASNEPFVAVVEFQEKDELTWLKAPVATVAQMGAANEALSLQWFFAIGEFQSARR